MSSPSFRNLVRKYLEDMQNVYRTSIKSGQATPELSYRPALDSFLRSLSNTLGIDSVSIVHEPRKQHISGRPDWRFHHTRSMGVFGYVEAKGFCPRSKVTWRGHKEQLDKYLAVGHNVVLTDGIDFLFFNPDKPDHPLKISILNKPLELGIDWSKMSISDRLKIAFLGFFKEPRARIISEDDLMLELAARSRNLSEDILNLVSLDPDEGIDELENRTIAALKDLKSLLQSEHDPELRFNERFAKTVAQVLIFGLFYAHRHLAGGRPDPGDLAASLHSFWTRPIGRDKVNRLRPFRALADILVESDRELSAINLWYADCILFLSYVRLSTKLQKKPDYHSLYEKFLRWFDPKDRRDFGAYATPRPLAKYVVSFCNAIAQNKFRRLLYRSENKIIDPCCGTGTFLEETLRLAQKNGVKTSDFPKLAGFEILPAPYALSQYRLTQLHIDGNPYAKDVAVALCNALSDFVTKNNLPWRPVSTSTDPIFARAERLLREERDEATRLAKPPITLIIGNPPSSDAGLHTDRRTCGTILRLVDDFRPPRSLRTRRQNIQKQMQNDFVKFLRWGCYKLSTQNPGILAFILPSAFLQHVSYTFARKWLLDNFSNVWVLEFDSDARTGAPTSNLFSTLQGRCVVFCSKSGKANSTQTVKYRSILELDKEQKSLFFDTASKCMKPEDFDCEFEEVAPTKGSYYKFKPQATYDKEKYSAFWSVAPKGHELSEEKFIFARHSSGIKLGITSAFVSPDVNILSRRIKEISSPDVSFASLKERWFDGQKKPPRMESLTPSVRDAIRRIIIRKGPRRHIKKYSFRPFLNVYAFLPEELLKSLAKAGGGGTRYRPEVMAAFSDTKNFGISIAPAPADIGESIQRFATFSWYIPDNDLCARGNAHVFCHLFPEYYKARGEWDQTPVSNINTVLVKSLIKLGANPKTVTADVVFYVYAVLVSNAYLKNFEGILYTTAGDWPKIPFPTDIRRFEKISMLGRQLAELEILDKLPPPPKNSQFSKLEKTQIRLKKYSIEPNSQTITLTDQENRTYRLKDIDRDCLLYHVSGYPVIAEWLKRHSFSYLRRAIGYQDFSNLHRLIMSLGLQLKLIQKIDQEVDKLIRLEKGKLL